jgi:hypothetical protein
MATIHIQLSIYAGRDLINPGNIETSLEVLNERCQIVRKTVLRNQKQTTLDLEQGEYLFRTYFPSGELVAQRVDVRTETNFLES